MQVVSFGIVWEEMEGRERRVLLGLEGWAECKARFFGVGSAKIMQSGPLDEDITFVGNPWGRQFFRQGFVMPSVEKRGFLSQGGPSDPLIAGLALEAEPGDPLVLPEAPIAEGFSPEGMKSPIPMLPHHGIPSRSFLTPDRFPDEIRPYSF
jgi:hypothetical protein